MNKLVKEKIDFIESNFNILTKAQEGSISTLVPMKLWRPQRHFIEHKTNRNAILKGRQMGISSGIEADNSEILFCVPYQRQCIITHDSETSSFLFENVQRFYRKTKCSPSMTGNRVQECAFQL